MQSNKWQSNNRKNKCLVGTQLKATTAKKKAENKANKRTVIERLSR